MKAFLFFPFAFLAVHLQTSHGVHKCSKEVIGKIEKLWEKEGTPKHLIEKGFAAKKQNILKTSKGYYPAGTSCVYTVFSNHGKSVKLTEVTVAENGKTRVDYEDVHQEIGVITPRGTGIKWYHVYYSRHGVGAWYICSDTAKKTGDPEGAVKVPHGDSFNQSDVKTAEDRLESVGIKLTTKYDTKC